MSVQLKINIFEKMYDIHVILIDFCGKFSMILADFLLPGSGSVSFERIRIQLTKMKRIRIRNTGKPCSVRIHVTRGIC